MHQQYGGPVGQLAKEHTAITDLRVPLAEKYCCRFRFLSARIAARGCRSLLLYREGDIRGAYDMATVALASNPTNDRNKALVEELKKKALVIK